MNGLDDGHHDNNDGLDEMDALTHPKLQARGSMDLEFHDLHLPVEDWNQPEHFKFDIKRGLPARNGLRLNDNDGDGSSSFDDSFGEASDDEEPDKQYLEELLDDEYHPERLNLLDNNAPPRKDKPHLQKNYWGKGRLGMKHEGSTSDSESERIENTTEDDESDWSRAKSDTSSGKQQEYTYDLSDHTGTQDDDSSEIAGWYPDGDGNDSDSSMQGELPGEEDVFDYSPNRRNDPSRPSIKAQMERLGKSTKRSFRTVGSQPFFSHPFKGLTRTLSGGKRKPRKLLEQQEVV